MSGRKNPVARFETDMLLIRTKFAEIIRTASRAEKRANPQLRIVAKHAITQLRLCRELALFLDSAT